MVCHRHFCCSMTMWLTLFEGAPAAAVAFVAEVKLSSFVVWELFFVVLCVCGLGCVEFLF